MPFGTALYYITSLHIIVQLTSHWGFPVIAYLCYLLSLDYLSL
jgi:hypothetical protein